MSNITTEQFARLPKYAQQYIRSLERANEDLRKKIQRDDDSQTPSKVWYEEFVNTGKFETVRRYVQSERVVFVHAGVHLTVSCFRDNEIELQWGIPTKHGSPMLGDISFVPTSYQSAKLCNPIYNPVELDRLRDSRERLENDGN